MLGELVTRGGEPEAIVRDLGFEQLSDDTLGAVVDALIESNPGEWARYREGDDKLAQFFIGQAMKQTKGQANGKVVVALLQARR